MADWPEQGTRGLVWTERPPSSTPIEPHEATVDHVAGRTFTIEGPDATFNRSTGRSKPVRHSPGAFGSVTYVDVAGGSPGARDVLRTAKQRDREAEASRAAHAWLADRSVENRRAVIKAMLALDNEALDQDSST